MKRFLSRLTSTFNESALLQALTIINRDIEDLEKKKEAFASKIVEDDINRLNELKHEISIIAAQIADRELRVSLINESLLELEDGMNRSEVEQIWQMYSNARSLLPELQVKFEQVVEFHNSMLINKQKFIRRELEPLTQELAVLKAAQRKRIIEELDLSEKINTQISLDEYNDVLKELNNKYQLKGDRQGRLEQISSIQTESQTRKARLDEINKSFDGIEGELAKKEIVFNRYFSAYSKDLYDEEYFLSHGKDEKNVYQFTISNIQANVGGGKKKGQTAAFDLAYINYIEEEKIFAPHFVLHDSTEDVSLNQLITITDIASKINGQYVLAILKEKFSGSEKGLQIIESNKILELSQEDKLFKF